MGRILTGVTHERVFDNIAPRREHIASAPRMSKTEAAGSGTAVSEFKLLPEPGIVWPNWYRQT